MGWRARRDDWRKTKTIDAVKTTRLTPNEIQCPSEREKLVTLPPMSGITSAGQHQAPMSAGTDITSVTNEMMRPRLSARASLRPPSSTPHPSPPPGNRASRSTSRAVSLSPAALGPQPTQSSCGTVPRWERGTYAHAITSPSCARNTALSRGGEVPGTGQLGGAWRARTLAEVTRTFPRTAAGIVGLARCRLTTILPLVAVHTFTPVQLGPRPRGLDKPERLILACGQLEHIALPLP